MGLAAALWQRDTAYSAPVTLAIDPTVDEESTNQVRAISVVREDTDLVVRFALFQPSTSVTDGYFQRDDTGQLILQTPVSLSPTDRSFTVTEQGLATPCGGMTTKQDDDQSINVGVPYSWYVDYMQNPDFPCDDDPPPSSPLVFIENYHHRDHLGTLRVVTDSAGFEVSAHDYYPFGMEMTAPGQPVPSGSRLRYTEHKRDELSDADYMMARYKMVNSPAFVTPDSLYDVALIAPSTWNKYAYVGNSPLSFSDPTGEMAGAIGFGRGAVGLFVEYSKVVSTPLYLNVTVHSVEPGPTLTASLLLNHYFGGTRRRLSNPAIPPGLGRGFRRRLSTEKDCGPPPSIPPVRTIADTTAIVDKSIADVRDMILPELQVIPRFWTGGVWDFKGQIGQFSADSRLYIQAEHFGNAHFGAVVGAMGYDLRETQLLAAAASFAINWKFADGLPPLPVMGTLPSLGAASIAPFVFGGIWPYGDINDHGTAGRVTLGHDYDVWKDCMEGR